MHVNPASSSCGNVVSQPLSQATCDKKYKHECNTIGACLYLFFAIMFLVTILVISELSVVAERIISWNLSIRPLNILFFLFFKQKGFYGRLSVLRFKPCQYLFCLFHITKVCKINKTT